MSNTMRFDTWWFYPFTHSPKKKLKEGEDLSQIKEKVDEIKDKVTVLYNWYVPPFVPDRYTITDEQLLQVISKLKNFNRNNWLQLDGIYYITSMDTFKKIIQWDWTDTRKYISETFDCDKFAMYFKSRMAIDFGINGVGVVLDYSSGHAYNVVIVKEGNDINIYKYEPQNDNIMPYTYNENPYKMDMYYLLL